MCVPSYCEVLTDSVDRPSEGSYAPGDSRSAAAMRYSRRGRLCSGGTRRPDERAVRHVGVLVPVSSLHFSRCSLACMLRLISCSPRSGSGARLYNWLCRGSRAFTLVRHRSTCSDGTGRDRNPARVPSSAPPDTRGCSIGLC